MPAASTVPGQDIRYRSLSYWLIISVFASFWLILAMFIAPVPGGTDVYVFKDAGCNLALGRGFTSLAMPSLDHRLYASYTPAYPFLWGVFASAAGCGSYSNLFFDYAIATIGTLFFAALVSGAVPQRFTVFAAILIGLALPCGMVLTSQDRPEALALTGLMSAVFLAHVPRPGRPLAAAFVAGLTVLAHPFAGAVAGLACWALSVASSNSSSLLSRAEVARAAKMFSIFLAPLALTVGIYWFADPDAFTRFSSHAFGQHSGAGRVFYAGYMENLKAAFFASGYNSMLAESSSIFAGIAGAIFAAWLAGAKARSGWMLLFVIVTAFAVSLLLFPIQSNYPPLLRGFLPVLAALWPVPLKLQYGRQIAVAVLITLASLPGLPITILGTLVRGQTATLYEKARAEAAEVVGAAAGRRDGRVAVIPVYTYYLYKSSLVDMVDEAPKDAALSARLICYQGQARKAPDKPLAPYLHLVGGPSTPYYPSLFGRRLTNGEWGWSCDRYAAQ